MIGTNTTVARDGLQEDSADVEAIGAGGLSGAPVRERSTVVLRSIAEKNDGSFPVIGVGGVFTASDANEKINAGATLVQVYTGFIYEGPQCVKRILRGISRN